CVYSSGSIYAQDSRFESCTVHSGNQSAFGGAIYTHRNLFLAGSTVTASSAYASLGLASGGGMAVMNKLTMFSSSISGNSADSLYLSGGGGIYTHDAIIYQSTIERNSAFFGGGIVLFGSTDQAFMQIYNSTITNNSAYAIGGVDVFGSGRFFLDNSTIAFNCAASQHYAGRPYIYGIGLRGDIASQPLSLMSSIIANNDYCQAGRETSPASTAYDVSLRSGSIDGGGNLIVTSSVPLPGDTLRSDPMLTPLADHGGSTLTLGLASGSPAIDAGDNVYTPSYDQRGAGYARVVGAGPDIGAYEVQVRSVVHTVSTCADSGAGSLRDTVAHAQSGDTIDLGGLSCGTIVLDGGALPIPLGNLTLVGPGASALTIDAGQHDRAIYHSGSGTLRISGVTIADGRVDAGAGTARGGCVDSFSTLEVSDSVLMHCQAIGTNASGGAISAYRLDIADSTVSDNGISATGYARGGGVYAVENLTMRTCTVTGNVTPSSGANHVGRGGGIYARRHASILSSTIAANQGAYGGGIYMRDAWNAVLDIVDSTLSGNVGLIGAGIAGSVRSITASTIVFNLATFPGGYNVPAGVFATYRAAIQSNIFFGNLSNGVAYDIGGPGIFVGANNLVGGSPILLPPDTIHGDPLLGPLQNNGGPTPTHALSAGSPAIDTGNNAASLQNDQRGTGFLRVVGANADIGAYELNSDEVIFQNGFD
ncbi:MAG TPA: choice-of-anchor Q domain-containing protein, partial [Rhodanobacteraceae bacterium]|nr:choice-of-anchor Q domain-containing protein [Rhodanobacteraceae bacterium]